MKITNNTANAVEITDLLNSGTTSQWQDGVRTLLIPAGEYRTIPNIQACNSVSLKTLYTQLSPDLVLDDAIEPDGTDATNPTWEIGGPIIGMPQ